jgi:hypothetical protein
MKTLLRVAVVLFLVTSPTYAQDDNPGGGGPEYWIKLGVNEDGTLRCKPNSNCHPLYHECCG